MRSSAATPAMTALTAAGVPFRTHTYEHDPQHRSYGLEAAEALGLDGQRIFKTLIVSAETEQGALAVAVVPVVCQLDLRSIATALGAKRAAMADARAAERTTGYVLGAISPLGQRKTLPTVIDETAELFDSILFSGGRRGLEIELGPAELIRLTNATVADIAR